MDKDTRNAIERATQRARRILEEDFASQLEGTFDVQRNGTIAAKPGPHLTARQIFHRDKIIAAVEHKRAAGMSAAEAVIDYLRDAAFTTLNRFVALKMLEARELVQECLTKGEQSSGYREFCGMAPGVALLPESAGHRLYVESLFDELSTEVKVLFDRRDPASALWPKRATFEELLLVLNGTDLVGVWGEDETIGWVYQYFNGSDERRKMRDESQAPRNSRELAVRNQFFTPRYVVQFLTDNTLGRIWYEMRQGNTKLVDACEYMVRKRDEVFVWDKATKTAIDWLEGKTDNVDLPELAMAVNGYLRTGSFDSGGNDRASDMLGKVSQGLAHEMTAQELLDLMFLMVRKDRFCESPPDALHAELQELANVLRAKRQNLTCVKPRAKKDPRDIRVLDPACGSGHFLLYSFDLLTQIYEEAYQDPEAPPSEFTRKRLSQDYASLEALHAAIPALILAHNLHGVDIDARCAQIAQLALWMRAQRAYRDNSIPRAERPRIRRSNIVVAEPLVADERIAADFVERLKDPVLGGVFMELVKTLELAGDLGLLLRVEDLIARGPKFGQTGDLFAPPEERIRATLAKFASDEDSRENTRRRLFAEDAAQGMGLLETAEKKYDVVLMNPPFGLGSAKAKTHFEKVYSRSKNDIYAAFVERGIDVLSRGGRLGAITSRTGFFLSSFQKWREEVILAVAPPIAVADLGLGVMDAALVESAAYCLEGTQNIKENWRTAFFRVLEEPRDKQKVLLSAIRRSEDTTSLIHFESDPRLFSRVPGSPFAYWVSESLRAMFVDHPLFEQPDRYARRGSSTGDDVRRVRLWWETPASQSTQESRWRSFAKGGAFARFYADIHLTVDWDSGRGTYSGFTGRPGRATERPEAADEYFRSGLTWSRRTKSELSLRVMPTGCIFGDKGPAIFVRDDRQEELSYLLAIVNSAAFRSLVEFQLAAAEPTDRGGVARSYEVGIIQRTPVPRSARHDRSDLPNIAKRAWALKRRLDTVNETSHAFLLPPGLNETITGLDAVAINHELDGIQRQIDARAYDLYGIAAEDRAAIESSTRAPKSAVADECDSETDEDVDEDETVASGTHEAITSWLVGVAFGRFDCRLATRERAIPQEPGPFDPLPSWSPGMWPEHESRIDNPPDVMVDDAGHASDIVSLVSNAAAKARCSEPDELRPWLAREFFPLHVKMYSKSRRKAPIYWQLATASASYSVWLYIHAFTKDTFYKVQNDYVAPKLAHEERKLEAMRRECGENPKASDRKGLATQESFVDELRAFLEEVKRVTPLWNPDLDDGVIINFAPLWRLVPHHKTWQKDVKTIWDSLCKGEYDWAHLAMHLWPERVVPKCATDRSLAIAHSLENEFWIEGSDGKWKARTKPLKSVEELVKERSSPAVKAALKNLIEAPANVAATKRGGATKRGKSK